MVEHTVNGDLSTDVRAQMVRAAVMVGMTETTYRRTGVGPTVVILLDATREDAVSLAPLAERCRVIVPDAVTLAALAPDASAQSPFAAWLHGFLEGLGVATARIVAPRLLAPSLAEFRAANPGLLKDVLLLDGSPSSWEDVATALFDRPRA